jgi:hypothetical protein
MSTAQLATDHMARTEVGTMAEGRSRSERNEGERRVSSLSGRSYIMSKNGSRVSRVALCRKMPMNCLVFSHRHSRPFGDDKLVNVEASSAPLSHFHDHRHSDLYPNRS